MRLADTASRQRSCASATVRSPSARSTSCRPSAFAARVRSLRRWRSASTSSSAAGSIRSRSSSWPSSSRQQVAVERQRRRAPLGVGRVALVHVGGHVVEQERRGERRGARGLRLDQRHLARVQAAQQLREARHVEHVAQALAVGLEHDRELAVALGHLEQRLRLQALLPERRALARVGARDQQRARGVLAEARAEQGRGAELAHDQVLELVGLDQHELGARAARRRRGGAR